MSSRLSSQLITEESERSPAARRVSLRRADPTGAQRVQVGHRPSLTTDALADIAVGLARADTLWRPHVRHDPLSRTSVRLLATDAYEVWLLGWTCGQRVELHDHGGSNATFVVLEGELNEITWGSAGTTTQRLGRGSVATVAAGVVHDVTNAGTPLATSLHVYSDPLRTMTFYDDDGAPRHTEVVEHVPALVTAGAQARALHPASGRP